MAATGFTPIQLYRTSTASAVPTAGNLADGELAINLTDERLYFKNASGVVKLLASNAASTGTVSSVAVTVPAFLSVSGSPITTSGTIALSYSGTALPVANGGTGSTSLTANNVLLGNGTSAFQVVAPGTSGNVLTSNGTTWTSAAPAATLSGVTQSVSPFETALGHQAGNVTTGVNNTWIGYQAGLLNTSGTNNTAVGFQALDANTTGGFNVAIGRNALGANTTASRNIAIGCQALLNNLTGSDSVAIGDGALQNNDANYNVAVGAGALNANTTGVNNSSLGYYALGVNTTGDRNVALGYTAGYSVSTGTQNTLIGTAAGWSGTNNLTTGSNNIIIGYNAAASSATVSNEVTIGNTSITSTRLRGMVELNAAMFEAATITATAATGTINFDARTQSVLYYTSNASANWTLNIRAASGVSLDSVMTTGESMTVAFLVTNGATAYYQTGFTIDGTSVTPKWQGGTAPTAGNASSIDAYVITVIKTGAATFVVLASQTRFA